MAKGIKKEQRQHDEAKQQNMRKRRSKGNGNKGKKLKGNSDNHATKGLKKEVKEK